MIHYAVFYEPDPENRVFPIDEVAGGVKVDDGKVTLYGSQDFIDGMERRITSSPRWEITLKETSQPLRAFFNGWFDHVRFPEDEQSSKRAERFEMQMVRIPNGKSKVLRKQPLLTSNIRNVRIDDEY